MMNEKFDRIATELEMAALSLQAASSLRGSLRADLLAVARVPRGPQRPLRIAVVGGFNRGKSSLINSLIGAPLLPTSVLPETISVTRVSYAERKSVELRMRNGECRFLGSAGQEELSREELTISLGDALESLQEIAIGHPADLLRRLEIVDTPGLGEAFRQFDERVAGVLAETDCVICVISATEPMSLEEVGLLDSVYSSAARPTTVIALTRTDSLAGPDEVTAVAANVMARVRGGFPAARFFPIVSSIDGIRVKADTGVAGLRGFLVHLADGKDRVAEFHRGWHAQRRIEAAIDDLDRTVEELSTTGDAVSNPDENVLIRPSILERRARFVATIRECRLQAQEWMRAFAERIDREVLQRLSDHEPAELQRRLHFFLVGIIGESIQACVIEHWPTLMDALECGFRDHSAYLAEGRQRALHTIGTDLGEWAPSDATRFTGELLGTLTDAIAPAWSRWTRAAWSAVQLAVGIGRTQSADAVVRGEVADLRSRAAEISGFLSDQIDGLYRGIERDLLEELNVRLTEAETIDRQAQETLRAEVEKRYRTREERVIAARELQLRLRELLKSFEEAVGESDRELERFLQSDYYTPVQPGAAIDPDESYEW